MKIDIVPFNSALSEYFYQLNVEWLQTYFYVEPFDEEVLSKPETYIIDKGGHIFFVLQKDLVIGTIALIPTENPSVFELTKMAILPNLRGHKIGQKLLQHCINFANENQFKALMLYSNTKLENAIYIYKKFGFIEIPVESDSPYKRSNIKMILKLN